MEQAHQEAGGAGPKQRSVEIGTAVLTLLFGFVVIYGSHKVGSGWDGGPQAGFFPFYVGIIICACSLVNLVSALREDRTRIFAENGQLVQVLKVLIPACVYVALVPEFGIYVPSILLILVFMVWLGKYGIPLSLAVAFGVPIFFYITLERWFLIPLPKGPVEAMLGL
ncbi:tripartite tricarboxylate transporter TctB family protein [Ancylobacter pratisalsi]|uniref:Tripartite tricarboxylate transporter TctB family protein n=1 Tax=Ancylobacter pratisalsi TaxID=1745854 RepID=A0A6P1YM02_9HYPH|nr:tripartite tricarboxylate transporter TctB family protein [Ancylobacter pratisalsi]QIB34122.1 tripartite tricarboxylate transporter TctB family protein [Ancylobacter pratisalsi]